MKASDGGAGVAAPAHAAPGAPLLSSGVRWTIVGLLLSVLFVLRRIEPARFDA